MRIFQLCIILCTFILCIHSKLIFINTTIDETFDSPSFQFLDAPKSFNITGRLVLVDPSHGCGSIKNSDQLEGNIALLDVTDTICYPMESLRNVQKSKSIAFVFSRHNGFAGDFAGTTYFGAKDIHIPGVEVVLGDSTNEILEITENEIVYVTIDSDGFKDVSFYIGFSVIMGIWSLTSIALAILQFRRFVLKHGFETSLAQVCLSIEIFCNAERIVMYVEPSSGLRRGCYDFALLQVFTTMSIPLTLISCMLIALYWNRVLRSFSRKAEGNIKVFSLEKWKIPFIGVAAVILILEMLADLWRGMIIPSGSSIIVLNGVIYILLALIGAVWFGYNGFKMLKFLRAQTSLLQSNSKAEGIQRLTRIIIVISVGLLLLMIGAAMTTQTDPYTFQAGLFIGFWGLNMVSTSQIIMFRVEDESNSSYTPQKNNTTTSGNTGIEMKQRTSSLTASSLV